MKKIAIRLNITIILLITLFFINCNNSNEVITEKKIYYKIYSEKDSLIGFSLRKYVFRKDTISEKYLAIDLKQKKINKYKNDFYKKGASVFIFSNIKNDNNKYLYFTPTEKDTCFYIDRKLENFYLCSKGKVNFKNHKNVFKVYYDERGYDTRKETLILDKDYTILARFEDCYDYRKEIIVKNNEINEDVKLKLENASKQILWW
jgi:hypothetical protein